ncbi:LysR family transcriptional regulator [Devosia sp. XJ19-1]|uniref:LysR family transcriptional regulator n=1 Tax=Devosia ureilytica TaxID=2952754 RepID=A0A9Q4AR76_9HYPH|nr:LysR family transcriptional regulator [Devosia ureilytica]MCP8888345.1 LysR family transcriptional regulator [Devosia ureilytica]
MDTTTVLMVDSVLRSGSLRGAARLLGRPVSSMSAALDRLEASLSTTLCQRAGPGLVLTLEADRLAGTLAEAATIVRRLYADAIDPLSRPVKFEALLRFVEVAERRSIRQAAHVLMLGQPQLSRQLAQLESVLGRSLLKRGAEGSGLTEEGAALRDLSMELLRLWESISRNSDNRFRRNQATIRLGTIMPLGHESEIARKLASLMASWANLRPRQPLFVSSTTADELLRGLRSGVFDIVLLDTGRLTANLEGLPVIRSSLAVAGAEGTDLASALKDRRIAVPSSRSGLRLAIDRMLETTFDEQTRDRLKLLEIDSIPVILNLVLHYGYVSVLPLASIEAIRPKLSTISLPHDFDVEYWVCWLAGSGHAAAGAAMHDAIQRASATA